VQVRVPGLALVQAQAGPVLVQEPALVLVQALALVLVQAQAQAV